MVYNTLGNLSYSTFRAPRSGNSSHVLFHQYYQECGIPESAYEVKNNLCLFERPFKIQKNGVFLFEISFFVLEILTFFYYAN